VFQASIESLDRFTEPYEYPVNETTGFRGKMKIIKDEDETVVQEEPIDDLESWEFDWEGAEQVLNDVQTDES
jgi:hypothetical protein